MVMECYLSIDIEVLNIYVSLSTKFDHIERITANRLPAMSIRGVILGFDQRFLDITTRSTDTIVIKVLLCCEIF